MADKRTFPTPQRIGIFVFDGFEPIDVFGFVEAFTPASAEAQFATNVFGPLRVNRAFLPGMRERKAGLIVYVSSVVGRVALPFGGIYTASKWALEALAEVSSYELAPFGVDIAIVQPDFHASGTASWNAPITYLGSERSAP